VIGFEKFAKVIGMQNFNELRREAEEAKERLRQDVFELGDILKRIAREGGENGRVEAEESFKQAEQRLEDAILQAEERFEKALASVTGYNLSYDDFVTREFDLKDFSNIEADCAIHIEVEQASKYSISVWASQTLQDYLSVVKSGTTLKLSLKSQNFNARPIVSAKVLMPHINKLRLGGATVASVTGFRSQNGLDMILSASSTLKVDATAKTINCEISGASRLSGNVQVEDADFVLSGASRVTLNGYAGNLTLSAWGASKIEMPEFILHDAEVCLKGASEANLTVQGKLDIDLSSGSRLTYSGNPTINSISVAGASSLNHK
jgi:hypothetical protein